MSQVVGRSDFDQRRKVIEVDCPELTPSGTYRLREPTAQVRVTALRRLREGEKKGDETAQLEMLIWLLQQVVVDNDNKLFLNEEKATSLLLQINAVQPLSEAAMELIIPEIDRPRLEEPTKVGGGETAPRVVNNPDSFPSE